MHQNIFDLANLPFCGGLDLNLKLAPVLIFLTNKGCPLGSGVKIDKHPKAKSDMMQISDHQI